MKALGLTIALTTSIFAMLPAITITAHARHGARGTKARAMTSEARPCVPASISDQKLGDSANLLCGAILRDEQPQCTRNNFEFDWQACQGFAVNLRVNGIAVERLADNRIGFPEMHAVGAAKLVHP